MVCNFLFLLKGKVWYERISHTEFYHGFDNTDSIGEFSKDTFYSLLKYHFNQFKSSVNNESDETSVYNYKQTLKKYQKWFDMGFIKWIRKINEPRFERASLRGCCVDYSYDPFDHHDSD